MKSLELKIPPALLMLIFGLFMWLIDHWIPQLKVDWIGRNGVAWLVFFGALLCVVLGIYGFKQAQTTVDPTQPQKASSIVTTGIYQWTRNPMYLGFLMMLFAFSIKLSNPLTLLLLPLFVGYMNQFQIKPEEQVLAELFGKEYEQYLKLVRRWV